jgi:putative ATP-binding cassette transporter
MALASFILQANRQQLWLMAGLTMAAGLANAGLVVIFNTVADYVAKGELPGLAIWLIFGGVFLTYYLCNLMALLRANHMIEELLSRLRLDVVDRLRQSELLMADKVGRSHLYSMVSQETNHLSVTFPLLMDSLQQAVLLVFSLTYLYYLSPSAFLVFILAVAAGIAGYLAINRRFRMTLGTLGRRQTRLLDAIGDIIKGGKELRLNGAKSQAVERAYRKLSRKTENLLVASGEHWAEMILLGSFTTFFMLGVVGFGFPQYVDGHSLIVFKLVPVLLFCLAPLAKIVAQSPMFLRAEVGLGAILHVQSELAAAGSISPQEAREQAAHLQDFKTIFYDGIAFTYQSEADETPFTVGPLSFGASRGEAIFLVGGNGSGKSTALRLICGLYPPAQGRILVDGKPLAGAGPAGFRELFSAIFVDFHLFDRLYGQEETDPALVNNLIGEMGLTGKVRYEDGRFTQLNLSTGQRKRLALIAALLEDRPIYLFDEWSAEQDIHFRKYFYETIIPRLRSQGKLVICVTHDERFWHLADRVIKLDLGAIVWERNGAEMEEK